MTEAQEGIFRSPDLFEGRTAHTKCGLYLLASSLAAALLDGLFEHPAGWTPVSTVVQTSEMQACPKCFSAAE